MPYDLGYMDAMQLPDHDPWTPDHTTFRARLALIRNHLGGWNVKKTADACGINPQTWRNWEAGGSVHGFEEQTRNIADALGCDLVWLRSGTPSTGIVSVTTGEPVDEQGVLFSGFRDRSHLSLVTR